MTYRMKNRTGNIRVLVNDKRRQALLGLGYTDADEPKSADKPVDKPRDKPKDKPKGKTGE